MIESANRMLAVPEPPLADDRILLRTWQLTDIDQIVAACADDETRRYLFLPQPYDRTRALEYVERTRRQWHDGSKAAFAIVEGANLRSVLGSINLAVSPPCGSAAYWVAPWARHHHIARRALQLVSEWAFTALGLGVVVLEIDPRNLASQHVARAAGFHEAGHLDLDATDEHRHLIFSRLAPDAS